MENISIEIKNALDTLAKKAWSEGSEGWWNKQWTREIKTEFRELGTAMNLEVFATDSSGGFGEWMWDIVWAKWEENNNGPDLLKKLSLVVESEWGKAGDVIEDYEKLLVARADLRVMIFDDVGPDKDELERDLERRFLEFDQRGSDDHYLIAVYRSKNRRFDYYEFGSNKRL